VLFGTEFFDLGLGILDFGFLAMTSVFKEGKSIKDVLTKLSQRFGQSNFAITDYWEADLCAIGIKNLTDKKHLIYISTNNLPKDFYFVEVEKANSENDLADYDVVGNFENINFEELSQLVTKYLNLQPIYEQ
jgi:hypothetical protein